MIQLEIPFIFAACASAISAMSLNYGAWYQGQQESTEEANEESSAEVTEEAPPAEEAAPAESALFAF